MKFPRGDDRPAGADWHAFKRAAPRTRAFNQLIAGTHFNATFGRWPLSPDDPAATINDVIFDRMIDPDWSALQRAFVDKETAKTEARRLVPGLRVPETLAVVPMEAVRSANDLFDRLQPLVGTKAVAKPTHASGAAVFLRDVTSPSDVEFLFQLSSVDYAAVIREMQYQDLPRKVIVERLVPTATAAPDDYKFHCVHGEPLVCQVDHNRFGRAWSRLLRVPDLAPMFEGDGLTAPATYSLPSADRIASMIEAAQALSAPFDFVRVDLYDGEDGIYFGELTFTPGGSLGVAPSDGVGGIESAAHQLYSRTMMRAIRGGAPDGVSAGPSGPSS